MKLRYLALALALSGSGAAHATTFEGSYVFGVGAPPGDVQELILTTDVGILTLGAINTGWYNERGGHFDGNKNYLTGVCCMILDHRSFFSFDLTELQGTTISSAMLSIGNGAHEGFNSPLPALPLSIFDVSTDVDLLATTTGTNDPFGLAVYADLGSGTLLGSQVVSAADNGKQVLIPLNAAAVAQIRAAEGELFAFGGTVPIVIPEPGTALLLATGLGLLAATRRRAR